MNFQPFPYPPVNNVVYPTRVLNQSSTEDLENNTSVPQSANISSLQELHIEGASKLDKCCGKLANFSLWMLGSIGTCCKKTKDHIVHNKITTFMTLQLVFVFLRLAKLISDRALFWLTFVPIFIVLIGAIVHLCIVTHRTANRLQEEQVQAEVRRQVRRPNIPRRDREQEFNRISERLMEQILMHQNPQQNRMDLMVAGQGGRVRFMNMDNDLQNLHGARMQIRLISRGLLRLLAEFIEEQQLQQARNQRAGLSEEQINEIPIEKYKMPLSSLDEPETCSICIDEFHQEQDLRRLSCNHRFHIKCIDEWLKISSTCPNCKMELQPTAPANNAESQA